MWAVACKTPFRDSCPSVAPWLDMPSKTYFALKKVFGAFWRDASSKDIARQGPASKNVMTCVNMRKNRTPPQRERMFSRGAYRVRLSHRRQPVSHTANMFEREPSIYTSLNSCREVLELRRKEGLAKWRPYSGRGALHF